MNRYVQLLDPSYGAQINNGTPMGGLGYLASQIMQGFNVSQNRRREEEARKNDDLAVDRFISGFQGQTQMREGTPETPGMAPGGYSNTKSGYKGALSALQGLEGPRARELMMTALQGQQQTQAQREAQARQEQQAAVDQRRWEATFGQRERQIDLAAQPRETPETFGTTPVQVIDPNTGRPIMALIGNKGTVRPMGYDAAPEQPSAPFEGTGIEAQDRNTLIRYRQALLSGEPVDPQLELAARLAYSNLSGGRMQTLPDGSVVNIPGADLSGMGFPNPNQQAVVSQPPMNGAPDTDGTLSASQAVEGDAIPGFPGSRQISPPKPKPKTEGQANAALYADRMEEANAILSDPNISPSMASLRQRTLGDIPSIGNFMVGDEYQMAMQAQRNFVNAVLRRESGAVISDQEFENAAQQYFPQPGDTPSVIAQKAQNRMTAIQGIRRASGEEVSAPTSTQGQGRKRFVFDPATGELVEQSMPGGERQN